MTRASFILISCVALALIGCGESHSGGDGSVPGTDGGGGAFDGGGGGGGGDAGGGATDGGGGGTDAGGSGPDGAVVGLDGGPGGADAGGPVGTDCMGMTCSPAEQCCITRGGPGGGAMAACIPASEMCAGATLTCDGPEDCGGDICCGRVGFGGVAVACEPLAECTPGAFGPFEVCHDAADCTTPGMMCCPVDRGGFSGAFCRMSCGFP